MPVMMMRPKPKAEHREELRSQIDKLFGALEREQPEGLRYAALELPEEQGYVVLVEVSEGFESPLPGLPEFTEFQAKGPEWLEETSPPPTPVTVVGSYRVFDELAGA